ncbi:MAG: branched-chain amino acid aminotransferase [Oscillospiraceae bacterium]|nr:branched-chain amino acid aminotransferase [Oscillospiraceae bacterium]
MKIAKKDKQKGVFNLQKINVELTKNPKQKPTDESALGFGKIFTDHMFLMNYDEGQGWHDPRIVPYAPISIEPSAMVFHYGQADFEGMKAYRGENGKLLLFRPEKNMQRLNLSNERLCIPKIDEDFAVEAIKQLVNIEQDWVPHSEGTSLYIRPFIFAVDPCVGVHPAKHLIFCIICSPVGAYYPEGLNPVKIYVEQNYVRAVTGGLGFTKAAANYAASLKAQADSEKLGYTQVLWLDGVERKYVEEVGTMNVFFVFGDEVVTPALQGSILGGITRLSTIELLRSWGYKVTERRLAIDEVAQAAKNGKLTEAFGTGTAAVISPIGILKYGDDVFTINNNEIGSLSQKLYDELTAIQWGKAEDKLGWSVEV